MNNEDFDRLVPRITRAALEKQMAKIVVPQHPTQQNLGPRPLPPKDSSPGDISEARVSTTHPSLIKRSGDLMWDVLAVADEDEALHAFWAEATEADFKELTRYGLAFSIAFEDGVRLVRRAELPG